MKNIILTIALLISSCVPKLPNIDKVETTYVDPLLEEYYADFITDAEGKDLRLLNFLDEELVAIYTIDDPEFIYDGFYSVELNIVFVNYNTLKEPMRAKLVLYHELGHVFGVMHTCFDCTDIMSQYTRSYDIYTNKQIYELEVDKLFKQIIDKINE